jgi:ribonuclease D
MTDLSPNVAATAKKSEEARWPLSFEIQPHLRYQTQQSAGAENDKPKAKWWSHLLYRGPNDQKVKVQYSKTKADSEILAKQFLKEKVVGFDMEWPWNDRRLPNKLQNKIGLIQVATEDKIALFHVGLHPGKTTDDIIAPSLRLLIESPTIGKIGVGILNADFARLSKFFKLQPKGAVELSHLHRLVTFGGSKPELVSTKMTSLAHQVEQHLKHPLYKGDVRTSNWSRPLSQEQIKYAAGDAYAGIQLYHCLNYKRLQMKPTPPLPIHAEKYQGYKLAGIGSLYLKPSEEGGKVMTSAFFFGVSTAPEDLSLKSKKAKKGADAKTSPTTQTKAASVPKDAETEAPVKAVKVRRLASEPILLTTLDTDSKALYYILVTWRTEAAAEHGVPEYRILSNSSLASLAQKRPHTNTDLLKIAGVGAKTCNIYGKQILGLISSFVAKLSRLPPGIASNISARSLANNTESPVTPTQSTRRKAARIGTPDSSPAFGTPPPPRTPQLSTGLSFALAGSRLEEQEDSDDSLPSLDFGVSPSARGTSGQKRKRVESPIKRRESSSSQKMQHLIKSHRYEEGTSEQQLPRASPVSRVVPQTPSRRISPTAQSTINPTAVEPLTPRSRIFRNKLVAFSKLVATKTQTSSSSLVSNETLDAITRKPPRTHDELRRIPNVGRLFAACVDVNMDLLAKVHKFSPVSNIVKEMVTDG